MSRIETSKELDRLLVEQSSELFEAVKHGSETERRNLTHWLLQSKRHVRTHLLMAALDKELTKIDSARSIPIPDVRSGGSSTLVSFQSASPTRVSVRRPGKSWMKLAAAAVLIVAVGTGLYTLGIENTRRWQDYRTAIGEQRALQLKDGSIVQINTGSHVEVRFTDSTREIRLLDGEALFKVHHDGARPFTVYAANATIVAVGTQFNVYRQSGDTRVAVLEGKVRVAVGNAPGRSLENEIANAPLIAAGETAEIQRGGQIARHPAPDVSDTAAWVQRRVVFKQETLENVVMEFNRYRKTPQFYVRDSGLALRKYSGTFDVDDPTSLADVLANERDIAIDRSNDAIVIRRRAENAADPSRPR